MTVNVKFRNGAAVERRGVCQVCHRALKNPKYVALGVGPICARRRGAGLFGGMRDSAGLAAFNARRAHYDVVKVMHEIVWIRDRDEDGVISVTNDAENVVRELHARYPGARIIYRDTIGRWDELKHDSHGTFTGFAPAMHMAPS